MSKHSKERLQALEHKIQAMVKTKAFKLSSLSFRVPLQAHDGFKLYICPQASTYNVHSKLWRYVTSLAEQRPG